MKKQAIDKLQNGDKIARICMKPILFILAIATLLVFSPLFVGAQKQRIEFPASLSIEETIAKMKRNGLNLPTDAEISVVGEVRIPGIIQIEDELSLVEALAYQGGALSTATGIIRILTPNSEGYSEELVDLKAVHTGKRRVVLKGGEIVIVFPGRKTYQRPPGFVLPKRTPTDIG